MLELIQSVHVLTDVFIYGDTYELATSRYSRRRPQRTIAVPFKRSPDGWRSDPPANHPSLLPSAAMPP
jgi:hypothetical protein